MKNDINKRKDIDYLVKSFYNKALTDPEIGYIFTDVAKINLEEHLPKISGFWESILLDGSNYKGNPMIKHLELNKKEALKPVHFERWLLLWIETINELFEGEKANKAIKSAKNIANLMQFKIKQHG